MGAISYKTNTKIHLLHCHFNFCHLWEFPIHSIHNMPNTLRLCTTICCKVVVDDLNLVCRNLDCTFTIVSFSSWFPCCHNRICILSMWAVGFFNLPMQSSLRIPTHIELLNVFWPWSWFGFTQLRLGSNFGLAIQRGRQSLSVGQTVTKFPS